MSFITPVVFIIYNRPELTEKVFNSIRKIEPKNIYVIADGPKSEEDKIDCDKARKVVEYIDWDCKINTNYSDTNLGCKQRISSGLDWVFSKVDEAIILEDDCLPSHSFFYYCDELLNKFSNEHNVMHIGANNFLKDKVKIDSSYYFSNYSLIWGWASWARVWELYDVNISKWPLVKDSDWLTKRFNDRSIEKFWSNIFDETYKSSIDTWDYQLQFAIWQNNGVSVTSSVNMVKNIGIDINALHTSKVSNLVGVLERNEIKFPLIHNENIYVNSDADIETFKKILAPGVIPEKSDFIKRAQYKIEHYFNKFINV